MGRKKFSELSPEVVAIHQKELSEKMRQAWKNRESNGLGMRINGVLQTDVQERIRESVKARWEEGKYQNRINGMVGITGSKHPNWTWGVENYNEIYFQFSEQACSICGEANQKIDVHHIDEDRENYLFSNLIAVCVPCHMWKFHYHQYRQPFVSISKLFSFEYSHILPWHPGKCSQLHGHSGHLEIEIRARLDPNGVVMDFYDLSQIVKMSVVDKLDHRFLNDYLENPTSEEVLITIWRALEDAGLKGLSKITFKETDSSSSSITKKDMLEAFGWDKINGVWQFVRKPSLEE